tara:strand:+ start:425 stop:631 length:207 start_codon:yes stop_codon:yes gene_type:complete
MTEKGSETSSNIPSKREDIKRVSDCGTLEGTAEIAIIKETNTIPKPTKAIMDPRLFILKTQIQKKYHS